MPVILPAGNRDQLRTAVEEVVLVTLNPVALGTLTACEVVPSPMTRVRALRVTASVLEIFMVSFAKQ